MGECVSEQKNKKSEIPIYSLTLSYDLLVCFQHGLHTRQNGVEWRLAYGEKSLRPNHRREQIQNEKNRQCKHEILLWEKNDWLSWEFFKIQLIIAQIPYEQWHDYATHTHNQSGARQHFAAICPQMFERSAEIAKRQRHFSPIFILLQTITFTILCALISLAISFCLDRITNVSNSLELGKHSALASNQIDRLTLPVTWHIAQSTQQIRIYDDG